VTLLDGAPIVAPGQLELDWSAAQAAALELLVVSYGVGLDSTAMLVEMHNRGERPDLILFADTGAEKPETYAYLATIGAWLRSVGFPPVTVVAYEPVRAPYRTLEGKCLANETLPSLALGGHSCALVFKRDQLVKHLKGWELAQDVIAQGGRIRKAIGYDDGRADRRRRHKADKVTLSILTEDTLAKDGTVKKQCVESRRAAGKAPLAEQWEAAHCDFWYPLQDWNLERGELAAIIEAAGLPVPPKSACFFCPATTPAEVVELKLAHPDLYDRAVTIERTARDGKHGLQTKAGLGMGGWAWEWLAGCDDPALAGQTIRELGAKVRKGVRP